MTLSASVVRLVDHARLCRLARPFRGALRRVLTRGLTAYMRCTDPLMRDGPAEITRVRDACELAFIALA